MKQETLDKSIFYNPTKEISAFLYPKIEEWYTDISEKAKGESEKEDFDSEQPQSSEVESEKTNY